MKALTLHASLVEIKSTLADFFLIFSLSWLTDLWNAFTHEINILWVAHLIALLILTLIVRTLGRWFGEHIDELSDLEFMRRFECSREVFETLKNPASHGLMYRPNKSYIVYDRNKLKITSKFFFISTVETFEVHVSEYIVKLKNISGKYESEVVYEYADGAIIAHWIAKPKGLRRAITLLFKGVGIRYTVEDFKGYLVRTEKQISNTQS